MTTSQLLYYSRTVFTYLNVPLVSYVLDRYLMLQVSQLTVLCLVAPIPYCTALGSQLPSTMTSHPTCLCFTPPRVSVLTPDFAPTLVRSIHHSTIVFTATWLNVNARNCSFMNAAATHIGINLTNGFVRAYFHVNGFSQRTRPFLPNFSIWQGPQMQPQMWRGSYRQGASLPRRWCEFWQHGSWLPGQTHDYGWFTNF